LGYSARYHAVSLVAVFIALAIGILIGAEFGGDTLSNTRKNLEESLVDNLQDARDRSEELSGDLSRANEFSDRVYPALVRDQLDGRRIGVVAFGDLPGDVSGSIEEALEPTGGRLVGIGVVREPVDLQALRADLDETRFADIDESSDTQTAFGVGVGRQIVVGGTLLDKVRGHLFSRASGSFGALDGVIVVRQQPDEMGPKQRSAAAELESGMTGGIVATSAPAVGVETSTADPTSISFFQGNDLSSVDDVNLVAGQLAAVYALLGAEGSFGVKGSADRLLPDLIAPPAGSVRAAGTGVAPAKPAEK
jgi:Copper transport outer membrane protein, MctB